MAVGYAKVRRDRIAKDPDRRIQEAIGLVFRKFAEFQSIRQVHLWLRQDGVAMPSVEEAADKLGVSKMTVLRLIRDGALAGNQACKGAPRAIPEAQFAGLDPNISSSKGPRTSEPMQKTLDFQ